MNILLKEVLVVAVAFILLGGGLLAYYFEKKVSLNKRWLIRLSLIIIIIVFVALALAVLPNDAKMRPTFFYPT